MIRSVVVVFVLALPGVLAANEVFPRLWAESTKLGVVDPPSLPRDRRDCLDLANVTEGDIGYLDAVQFRVYRMPSATTLILSVDNVDSTPLRLRLPNSSDLTPGKGVRLVGLVEIGKTETDAANNGYRMSVREVRFVELEKARMIEAKALAEQQESEGAAAYRTWSSADGNFTAEARLAGLDPISGGVILQKRDESKLSVDLKQLSAADQEFVRLSLQAMIAPPKTISVPPIKTAAAPMAQSPPPRDKSIPEYEKQIWKNVTYKSFIRHAEGNRWEEVDNATGEVRLVMIEKARTPTQIDFFVPKKNYNARLIDKRMEFDGKGSWQWVASGYWAAP